MLTVLIPHPMPERCYLSEAVLWAAVNRIPVSFVTENNIESREDYDYFDDMEPYVPDGGIVSVEECEQSGLEPNPYWEEIDSGKTHLDPTTLKNLLRSEKDENRRRELEKELSESKDFRKRQAEWDANFKEFIDVRRNKLFLSLSEGRIGAIGKKLPQPTLEWSSDDLEEWEWLRGSPWEAIPATFWISFKIDWDMSRAEGRGGAYRFIMIPTADLMREFPLPEPQVVSDVVRIGSNLVVNSGTETIVEMPRKGRPAQNWDEFHLEVARWVAKGALPDKQDSFIEEMQDWCKNRWGRPMGRSTLLEKIKPYYDTFVRSKVIK